MANANFIPQKALGNKNGTNAQAPTDLAKANSDVETNMVVQVEIKLNGSNSVTATNTAGTNTDSQPKWQMTIANKTPFPGMAGMDANPFAPPGKRGADLPPAVQARIIRITDSEILGPVIHPLPIALLGIAGGGGVPAQTGLVKVGDSLDDLKLIRNGINRVLIEQYGQKNELTIF